MQVRYQDLLRHRRQKPHVYSYSDLTAQRREGPPVKRRAWRTPLHLRRLLVPYLGGLHLDQFRAVAPLAAYLALFQIVLLQTPVHGPRGIVLGLGAVVVGLVLFMEGLRVGLMPFGEAIGHSLPQRLPLRMVLMVAFVLGIGVTLAEPAIGALQTAGASVDPLKAPYLYAMLNSWSLALVAAVGLGVGLAATLGLLRFLLGWSLKPLIFGSVGVALVLSVLCARVPGLGSIISLAWDCGAVTTGPVTVPLVLALGLGVARSAGDRDDGLAGFGIVTLASLVPVITVLGLGLLMAVFVDAQTLAASGAEALAQAQQAARSGQVTGISWISASPWADIIAGIRAIVPLVGFLVLVARYLARTRLEERDLTLFGIALTLVGMIIFNLGLSYGLSALGMQAGSLVPTAFSPVPGITDEALYGPFLGLLLAVAFAWVLGFGATVAEPALNAMGATVETLTNGAMSKKALIFAVSVGVGCGIALGLLKLVFDIPVMGLLLPLYGLACAMTLFSNETFVNVAWDSAGVTTGPVTVPLVLAMGLGLGQAVGAVDGFGILAMASLGPIISVLGVGLLVRWRLARLAANGANEASPEAASAPLSAEAQADAAQ